MQFCFVHISCVCTVVVVRVERGSLTAIICWTVGCVMQQTFCQISTVRTRHIVIYLIFGRSMDEKQIES